MAKRRNRWCRQCGNEAPDGERISSRGLCSRCSHLNHIENTTSIVEQRGSGYRKWVDGLTEAAAAAKLAEICPGNPAFERPVCPSCGYRDQTVTGLCVVCELERATSA